MLYKLHLPLHLQPLHRPQHEQHARARTVKLQRPLNTLSEGILDCLGASTSGCTRRQEKQRRIPPYEQPRGLEREAGENSSARFSPRALHMSRVPPGYYFGERMLLPECSSRWLSSDVFSTWTPSRGCINGGMLDFLSEEKTMYCTKLLLERAVYCQEQDGETIRRVAHRSRAQAWISS